MIRYRIFVIGMSFFRRAYAPGGSIPQNLA